MFVITYLCLLAYFVRNWKRLMIDCCWLESYWGFPGSSDGKESTCSLGDPGSILGLGRSLGEGNGNPLQYSDLKNSTDRGAWWAPVHGVVNNQT